MKPCIDNTLVKSIANLFSFDDANHVQLITVAGLDHTSGKQTII